jgi:hypothetical protein
MIITTHTYSLTHTHTQTLSHTHAHTLMATRMFVASTMIITIHTYSLTHTHTQDSLSSSICLILKVPLTTGPFSSTALVI